jgi:hypothetical protein
MKYGRSANCGRVIGASMWYQEDRGHAGDGERREEPDDHGIGCLHITSSTVAHSL